MSDAERWNERYLTNDFVYGTEPNLFFMEQLALLPPGRLLLPGEGEGRNATYAARNGWQVDAFDQSETGKKKADVLAAKSGVSINYHVDGVEEFNYTRDYYDVAGVVYFHIPKIFRPDFYMNIKSTLKTGGRIILEVFHTDQLSRTSGGPKNIDLLYSLEEIKDAFRDFQALILEKKHILLNEGSLHQGEAVVIRYCGIK